MCFNVNLCGSGPPCIHSFEGVLNCIYAAAAIIAIAWAVFEILGILNLTGAVDLGSAFTNFYYSYHVVVEICSAIGMIASIGLSCLGCLLR